MIVLAFDTATAATVVGLARDGVLLAARRDDPAPGERPAHTSKLLTLCGECLEEAGLAWADIDRLGAGVGPGSFTGLRIGVATARALAQGLDTEIVAVDTLAALRPQHHAGPALTVLDARRGEAFLSAWSAGGERLLGPLAWAPERLPEALSQAPGPWLAAGDGAVRFREHLEPAGVTVADDDDPVHGVSAAALCRLAAEAEPVARDALVPVYVRDPDAKPKP